MSSQPLQHVALTPLSPTRSALAKNWSVSYDVPPPSPLEGRRLTENTPLRKIDAMEHLVLLDLLGAKEPSIPSFFSSTDWLFQELVSAEERLRAAGLLYPAAPAGSAGGTASSAELNARRSFFRNDARSLGHGGIEDDHLPFLANGVPVLHVIPSPFPKVWHTLRDDASALDYETDYAWAMILRTFVAEYLGLELEEGGRGGRAAERAGGAGAEGEEEEEGWANDDWIRGNHEDLASISVER